MVTIGHHYTITFYGYGILNDTITFSNPGASAVQISSIQLGIPDGIVSRAAGLRFVSSTPYTTTKAENNGTTLFTITPGQPTLAPHATSTVSLESYVKDVLNTTTTSKGVQTGRLMLMTAPSINQHVDVINLAVQLPLGVALKTAPTGFTATTNNTGTYYQKPIFNATSQSSSSQYFEYSMADTTHFHPVEFFSATRSLTASTSGSPQISDSLVLKNLGSIPLSTLKLSLISKNVSTATVVAPGSPPLVNPRGISIIQGVVDFTRAPFPGGIAPGDNYSFTLVYDVPSDAVKVSGGAVTVPISHSPPVDGVVGTYTIQTSFPDGITSTNSTTIKLHDATPFDRGTTTFRYSLSLGWGAAQAVPIASVLFAVAFIGLVAYRQTTREPEKGEEEKQESGGGRLLDATKAFEDKLALVAQTLDQLASKQPGTMGKTDFDKMRSELDALRSRALQRLNEAKVAAGPGRYFDLLTQIQDAAREENRAARDLINLYEQYQTRRMREDTFQKLLPNYRRRLNGAINRLSDLLNAAQKEAG
jgi:hypothetical protein